MRFLLGVFSVLLATGCSSATQNLGNCDGGGSSCPGSSAVDGGASDGGPYLAKCQLACKPDPKKPCAGQDPTQCVEDCVAYVSDLSSMCALCVTEHSGWYGNYCDPKTGVTCPFSAAGGNCAVSGSSHTCAPSDDTCDGYTIVKATGGLCGATCK